MAASSSSSEVKFTEDTLLQEAAETVGVDPGEPIKNLADMWESETRDKLMAIIKTVSIGGLSFIITYTFRHIIGSVYTVIMMNPGETVDIIWSGVTQAGSYVMSAPSFFTPEFLIMSYAGSFMGQTFIKNTVIPLVKLTTPDPAVRVKRVEFLTAILGNVDNFRKHVDEAIGKVASHEYVKMLTPSSSSASSSSASSSSASSEAAAKPMAAAPSSSSATAAITNRDLVFHIRDANRLWVLSQPAFYELATLRSKSKPSKEDDAKIEKMNKSILDLQGRIVSMITTLEQSGVSEKEIEEYVGDGLPGFVGIFYEGKHKLDLTSGKVSKKIQQTSKQIYKSLLGTLQTAFYRSFVGRSEGARTRGMTEKLNAASLEIIGRVEEMNAKLDVEGHTVPEPSMFKDAVYGGVSSTQFSKGKGDMLNLISDIHEFLDTTPPPTEDKIPTKARDLFKKYVKTFRELVQDDYEDMIRARMGFMPKPKIHIPSVGPVKRGRDPEDNSTFSEYTTASPLSVMSTPEPTNPTNTPDSKRPSVALGRRTRRKKKRNPRKKSRHTRRSVNRKKGISHRRRKRTHRRRRTNRRTPKRTKK